MSSALAAPVDPDRVRALADQLEAATEWSDDADVPLGWPAYWTDYLRGRLPHLRRPLHRAALLYVGQPARQLAREVGVSTQVMAATIRSRAFLRIAGEVGHILADGEDIATREDVMRFWTEAMMDPRSRMGDRLKASELLAKSLNAITEQHRVEVTEGPSSVVDHRSLEERIRLLGAREVEPERVAEDDDGGPSWLQ